MIEQWKRSRQAINHDWLKNIYIKGLEAFILRVSQKEPDIYRIQEFLDNDFIMWENQHDKIFQLLETLEDYLSPHQLFDTLPLSQLPMNTKNWLKIVVHELWLNRYAVKEWIEDGKNALDNADFAYNSIMNKLKQKKFQPEECRDSLYNFENYLLIVRKLSQTISELPHKILVV